MACLFYQSTCTVHAGTCFTTLYDKITRTSMPSAWNHECHAIGSGFLAIRHGVASTPNLHYSVTSVYQASRPQPLGVNIFSKHGFIRGRVCDELSVMKRMQYI